MSAPIKPGKPKPYPKAWEPPSEIEVKKAKLIKWQAEMLERAKQLLRDIVNEPDFTLSGRGANWLADLGKGP